jgi:hypothetical protein
MLFAFVLATIVLAQAQAAELYVATTGADTAAGTLAAPLKTIQAAVNKAVSGTTIYLRGGTYTFTANVQIKACVISFQSDRRHLR